MTTFEGPPIDRVEGIGALTLGGFLDEVADRFAANEALVFDDPLRGGATVRWTYADLGREAHRVARALIAAGASNEARPVGILMGNRPEAVAALFGAALAGAVAVPHVDVRRRSRSWRSWSGRPRSWSCSPRSGSWPAASPTTWPSSAARPAVPHATSSAVGTELVGRVPRRAASPSTRPRSRLGRAGVTPDDDAL